MVFELPLIEGTLLKRYKRFLADVLITKTGETVLVHVPNSGSMTGVKDPGSPCRISISKNLSRKIPYTLEMVQTKCGAWVGVNTSLTNKLVAEAFAKGLISHWNKFEQIQSEVKINELSRLDFLLTNSKLTNSKMGKCYVEVKNVSMARPPFAVFPDAVTERGQKHLRELMKLSKRGFSAELFFVVQREDCHTFKPCDDIDSVYGELLREAATKGVVIRCWACKISSKSVLIERELKVDLSHPLSKKNSVKSEQGQAL